MITYLGLDKLDKPIKRACVTIGIFDGLHIGHTHLIQKCIELAKKTGSKSAVITFWPHPSRVVKGATAERLLISLRHRLELFEALGVDICIVINFNSKISRLMPDEFIKMLFSKGINMRALVVGSDFVFGHNAAAGIESLKFYAEKFNFILYAVEPLKINGHKISSSLIRRSIESGKLDLAKKLLGRPVSILGKVIHGDKIGRLLGAPTANIKPEHEICPPSGVYAVKVKLGARIYNGALNIGFRPTIIKKQYSEVEPRFEVHIFGFNKKIYGRDIEVIFIKKIRNEIKFINKAHLISRIKKDILEAKKNTVQ